MTSFYVAAQPGWQRGPRRAEPLPTVNHLKEDLVRNKRALRIISGMGGVVALVALTPSSVFGQDGPDTQAFLDNI